MNKYSFLIFPFLAGVIVITILLMMDRERIENQRIYQKCLTNNSTMAYNEVTKMCKEFVK